MNLYCRILIFCLFAIHVNVKAQFGTTPQIINFPKTEYNASNQNWSIDQDSTGNIFVANNKGLLIYNGAWSLYELPGQQIVRSVACDNNRIYTGGFGEFGYWEKELLGNYNYHSLTKKITYKQFSKEEIWKISKIDGKIYFQSFSTIYVLDKDKITPISCPGNIMYAFSVHGHIYVQVLKKGLYELKGTIFSPISTLSIFQTDEIITIVEGTKNTAIIGTVHNGIYQLENNTVTPFTSNINTILKTAQLNAGIKLSDTSFAVGTIQRGVYILHEDGRILEHFDQQNGLQNKTVLSLKKDLVGNLWVGMDRGLDQIVLKSPLRYFQDVNGDIGSVYAAALYNGHFYIGSNDGLYIYDRSLGFKNVAGINWQVWSLNVLNGQLFCAHNSGVLVVDQNGISQIPNMPGGWAIKQLNSNPDFALQGTYIGLSVYQKGSDGSFHFKQKVKGLETMPISDWIEDANGNIWLKHAYKGISRIKLNNSKDSVVQIAKLDEENGVQPEIQQNISYWNNNLYSISTEGVKMWNMQTSSFDIVKDLFGYSRNQIKRVFAMPNNSFWIVKDDNQLSYIDAKKQHTPFSLRDFSLVGGYENIVSIDNYRSILCGENGFALFDSNKQLLPKYFNKPIIGSVFINDGSDFLPIVKIAKSKHSRWEIKYENRSIKFIVTNTVFDRMVQYRFRLNKEGEQGYWGEWQTSTTKVYTNLPAGNYKLEVQTNLISEPAVFDFSILSPWYWTWWSKLIYFGIFAFGLVAFYDNVEKKHRRKLRLKQIEMDKQLFLQKMQHENELLLLKKEKLEEEVQLKSEDLANSANELIKRKKLLNKLHIEIGKQNEEMENKNTSSSMKKLSRELERQLKLDKEESNLFEHGFNTIHESFFSKLLHQYPNLTPQDLKLAAYLRMNLGSKEIAPLLNITVRGVELKRYRLRKKMELEESVNLNEFMMKFK